VTFSDMEPIALLAAMFGAGWIDVGCKAKEIERVFENVGSEENSENLGKSWSFGCLWVHRQAL
jgi:hypothetical protein